MSENTKIEWCDSTFNPVIGCTKISPGCDGCYAAAQDKFRSWTPEGWGGPRKRTSAANWQGPVKWNKLRFFQCDRCGWRGTIPGVKRDPMRLAFYEHTGCGGNLLDARQRVFCASLADVFDNQWDPQWRRNLFDLIELTPNLDWLLLTKRVGNVAEMVSRAKSGDWLQGQRNVMLGATIVNQEEADRDIPKLLAVPAHKRFLSMEPLLGPVDLRRWIGTENDAPMLWIGERQPGAEINWVIVGGESGPGARPMHPDWARSLRDQCAVAGVPMLFKQWGEWASVWHARIDPALAVGKPYVHVTPTCRLDGTNDSAPNYQLDRVGKKAAGRVLDGITHDGFPS